MIFLEPLLSIPPSKPANPTLSNAYQPLIQNVKNLFSDANKKWNDNENCHSSCGHQWYPSMQIWIEIRRATNKYYRTWENLAKIPNK